MFIGATVEGTLDPAQPIGAQLYAILRARVIRGVLKPGTRLSEAGTAAEFDVSRQPVREVFIRLAEDGLLEIRPQRGSVVPKISPARVEDARFVREAIEADVAREAATVLDAAQIAKLDTLLRDQERAQDVYDFMTLDDAFHRTLAHEVGRGHAWQVVEALKAQLDRVRFLSLKHFAKEPLIAQHVCVVDAIRAGDAQAAQAAMRSHLKTVTRDLPQISVEHKDFFTTQT